MKEKNGRKSKKEKKKKKKEKKGGGRGGRETKKQNKKRVYMLASPVSTRCGSCMVAVELSLILPIVCRVDRPDITVMVDWTLNTNYPSVLCWCAVEVVFSFTDYSQNFVRC